MLNLRIRYNAPARRDPRGSVTSGLFRSWLGSSCMPAPAKVGDDIVEDLVVLNLRPYRDTVRIDIALRDVSARSFGNQFEYIVEWN